MDLMSGVLIPIWWQVCFCFFVLIMCVTLFQAQKSYNESLQERDEKIALQEEYTQELLDKQNALDKKDETLQNQDAQLKNPGWKTCRAGTTACSTRCQTERAGIYTECTAVGIGRKDRAVKRSAGADRPDHRCEGRRNWGTEKTNFPKIILM